MTTSDKRPCISDDDAAATLALAVEVAQDVLGMVHAALKRADLDDANAIHAAELKAQRQRIDAMGAKPGEQAILRAHPLFALWKLAMQATDRIDRLLSITNPGLYAQRAVAVDVARELRATTRLALKAESTAA
jgi:hypothetical protein